MAERPGIRRAFVGFSSPLAYDYSHQASRAPADNFSSPNPILDGPFGLMILFDELVFLTRSLCPENMRQLPFVRFLDEEGFVPDAQTLTWERIRERLSEDPVWRQVTDRESTRPIYEETLTVTGATWTGIDNHSHGLTVAGLKATGNADAHNLVLDFLILEQLGQDQFELVTNSFTQPLLEPESNTLSASRLTELLVVRGIHNYLSPEGPYHPVIDEARESRYLVDFRRWMSEQHTHFSASEVRDAQHAVENEIQRLQDEVFLKHLGGKWSHYVSVGKAIIGDGIGLVVPGTGVGVAIAEEALKHRRNMNQRWAGFIVEARSRLSADAKKRP
jgi:hypothetical protein